MSQPCVLLLLVARGWSQGLCRFSRLYADYRITSSINSGILSSTVRVQLPERDESCLFAL